MESRNLSFADGFQFGCGFLTAVVTFWVILVILLAVVGLVLSLLGFEWIGTILRGLQP
ncbi:MAG: hypothetical protein ACUVXG_12740 [Anaerolineae bacterium]